MVSEVFKSRFTTRHTQRKTTLEKLAWCEVTTHHGIRQLIAVVPELAYRMTEKVCVCVCVVGGGGGEEIAPPCTCEC